MLFLQNEPNFLLTLHKLTGFTPKMRQNAARSTSGKDRSRMNALRHGLSYVGYDLIESKESTKKTSSLFRATARHI
jgi:hypothetical protein